MKAQDRMREQERRDAEARRLAQRVFDRPLVLEAGAGTGKTATLVARIASWCMGPGWDRAQEGLDSSGSLRERGREHSLDRIAARVLDGVVAITFTEAAAAEMAARVGEILAEIHAGKVPKGLAPESIPHRVEVRRLRARALMAALDHLRIHTIHAFCFRLLASYPLEADLHPSFTVDAHGRVLEQVVQQVITQEIRDACASREISPFLALAARGFGPQEIAEALIELAGKGAPEEVLRADPFAADRIRAMVEDVSRRLKAFTMTEQGRLHRVDKRSALTHSVLELIQATLNRVQALEVADRAGLQGLCDFVRASWTPREIRRLKDWEAGRFTQSEAHALGTPSEELMRPAGLLRAAIEHLGRLEPGFLAEACAALELPLHKVYGELRSRGVETFGALLRDARDLLEDHAEVRKEVRQGISQLLIDEFQDTDRIQCEIVRLIALEGPRAERPGLLVVGDPKQAIYGWRDADLQAYEDFVGLVKREGGGLHALYVNFRSAPVILEEVGRIVAPIMRESAGLQPAFQPLCPCPDRANSPGFVRDPWAPVEYWVSWKWDEQSGSVEEKTRSADAAELEARALAVDILRLHEEAGIPWRTVGVLFRNTSDLDTYLSAFKEAGIPYVVERDKSYYRRREIIEISALVRCVLDPNDHLALLTLMRSAMVGVPDAALIPLWRRSFPALVTEVRRLEPDRMSVIRVLVEEVATEPLRDIPGLERIEGWHRNLLAAVENLGILREAFETEPADVFVEKMRTLFLVEPTEAARYLGAYRLANLDCFFRSLLEALQDGGGDRQAILRELRASVARAREAEEGRPKEAAENAVQVMTIHKAKGLDFDHVYLVQTHKGSRGRAAPPVDLGLSQGRFEYALFGIPTPGYDRVMERNRAVEAAELVRTLYVAVTRARDRLVLAGRWPSQSSPQPPRKAKNYMDLLQHRAGAGLLPAGLMPQVAADGNRPYIDAAEARWVFPSLSASAESLSLLQSSAAPLPSPDEVLKASERLTTRVRRATARMARPFRGLASEEAHEALRELLARPDRPPDVDPDRSLKFMRYDDARRVSLAVGTAIHRVLETLDLDADPSGEMARQRASLRRDLARWVDATALEQAIRRAESLLERFENGRLHQKLRTLRGHIIGREVPVFLPPPAGHDGPVGYVSGAIDLLYRDPESGGLVVVDFKTDEIQDPEEIKSRKQVYASQGDAYVRAVREALELEADPLFEIWFIHPDRVELVG